MADYSNAASCVVLTVKSYPPTVRRPAAPLEMRINAEYTWLIRAGISPLDTVLLLTTAPAQESIALVQKILEPRPKPAGKSAFS